MVLVRVSALLVACLLCSVEAQSSPSSSEQLGDATERSGQIIRGLYNTLRNIAFPAEPLTDSPNVMSRFLLLSPGKILNYDDYFPGSEYTSFKKNGIDSGAKETLVPPSVMEKWFDLADAVPNANPLNAADTGKSLSNIYRQVIYQLKVLGLEAKTQSEMGLYNQALNMTNELVPDPDNISEKVPRLTLYERYRDQYNGRKLELEETIEDKRQHLGAIDYQLWFQRNYPALQSKVESTYTKWVIFGEKQLVELYIAVLDTGSAGQALEEARMSLRASGVVSLDRTRTIYPVSFEPSDWYRDLLPDVQKPSRDQLQAALGTIMSKVNALNAMIASANMGNSNLTSSVRRLRDNFEGTTTNSRQNLNMYMNAQFACMSTKSKDACDDFESQRGMTVDSLASESEAFSTYQYANYFDQSKADYVRQLEKKRDDYQVRANHISAALGDTSPFLGGIVDDSTLSVANVLDANTDNSDDRWFQFEFDSQSHYQDTQVSRQSESVSTQWKARAFFFSTSGSATKSNSKSHFEQSVSNSSIRVKGELLRVTIKRPWFKPSLFENPELQYQESDGNGRPSYIAPGAELTETDYYNAVTNDRLRYLIPEYPTSFLLARRIELEFSGMDDKAVHHATSEFSRTDFSASIGFFSVKHSRTKSKANSQVNVQRTANGMKIKIPGAQLIGYYTIKVPRFPPSH